MTSKGCTWDGKTNGANGRDGLPHSAPLTLSGGPQTLFWGAPIPPPAAESIPPPPINHCSSLASKGMRRFSRERASAQSCKRAILQARNCASVLFASVLFASMQVKGLAPSSAGTWSCKHSRANSQACKRASTRLCKQAGLQTAKHAVVQGGTCNFASMGTGKCASTQLGAILQAWNCANIQAYDRASMHAPGCASLRFCKCTSMWLCKLASVLIGLQPCPPVCLTAPRRVWGFEPGQICACGLAARSSPGCGFPSAGLTSFLMSFSPPAGTHSCVA